MATTASHERTRRPFWFDPRFVIGLALVLASVAGVYAIVTTADRSTPVYAAKAPLVAGQTVDDSDFTIRSVRLGSAGSLYLAKGALDDGAVVTRTVAAGELVPLSAIGSADTRSQTSVVLTVHGSLAASVEPGTVVDVWSAALEDHNTFAPPTVLVGGATVVRVIQDDGLVAQQDRLSVEVRIPKKKVAAVLAAIANADDISLVPAAGDGGAR